MVALITAVNFKKHDVIIEWIKECSIDDKRSSYDIPFYKMYPSKHNAIARDGKLAIEPIESDRGVKHCKSGLEFFLYDDQNVLVFGHPMAHLWLKSHKIWESHGSAIYSLRSTGLLSYIPILPDFAMKTISKLGEKG